MQEAFGNLTREYKRARALLDELDDAIDGIEKQRHPVLLDQSKKLGRQLRLARVLLHDLDGLAADYPMSPALKELLIDVDRQLDRCDRLEDCLARLAPATAVPAANLAPLVDNLPPGDLFVGREAEMAQCLEGLSPQERGWGVVIDGQGGLGKTSLALAVAHFCRREGCFGAYLWVSAKTTVLTPRGVQKDTLAPTSLDALLDELGRLLGTEVHRLSSTAQKRQHLERALQGTRALLVLDNLETLSAEDRQEVGEFLRRLPRDCKAIVTSRRRSGESAVTVRLDRLPWQTARELFGRLAEGDAAVRALVDTLGEVGTQKLYEAAGGSPLALRWTVRLITEKDYSFARVLDLLGQAAMTSDLHGFVFAEALEQTSPADQRVFAALALFRAPASLDLLAAASGLDGETVRAACERLVQLSLAESEAEHERFHLLPLTRALARTRVDTETGFRYAQACLAFARAHGGDHPEDFAGYERLEAEWPNLEGCLMWLQETGGNGFTPLQKRAAAMLPELIRVLRRFLWFRGYWNELVQVGKQSFDIATATEQWLGAVWGAQCLVWVYGPYARNEPEEAERWMQRLLYAAAQCGIKDEVDIYRQRWEGLRARARGDFDRAEVHLQAVLYYCRAQGSVRQLATVLNDLGSVACDRKDYDRAHTYYQQAYAQAHKLQEERASIALNLGLVALHRQDLPLAQRWLQEGLGLAEAIHRRDLVAEGQFRLARVLARLERRPEARDLAEQALSTFERLRHTSLEAARALSRELTQERAD
ncbi:tetratricopeptide repeat protein [Gloeobacter morelensis]|uniref:Tetratricopeptide repeat protein n=1 Tax=Gloeobacter morelensis MG652769 TaxID=2781736 RepID=A0ABY3PSL2_9CYAN|nr:tetratricopeptide repeat protein [Gloeobacter morelensis]UFP96524.1 tetratricopeptide repeat protein [Gloeobacter morelensis MG652769]